MERRTGLWVAMAFTIVVGQLLACAEPEQPRFDVDSRESPAPLSELTSEMRSQVLSNKSSRAVMCSPIAELPRTSLCFFKTRRGMNAALGRIQQRVETERGLLTDREHVTNPAHQILDGHDLQVADIAVVLQEHDLTRERTAKDAAPQHLTWMIDFEREFRERYLIPLVIYATSDVLLAVVADGDDGALHHELLHAAFFTDSDYRAAVKGFWDGLAPKQRAGIKLLFASIEHDVTDEVLVLNELQAYLLMTGAPEELLGEWAHLADPLSQVLAAKGISPPLLNPGK